MIPVPDDHFGFWCPGCIEVHHVPVQAKESQGFWGLARNAGGQPTLTPSVLTFPRQVLVPIDGRPVDEWMCRTTPRCHLVVVGGRVKFLDDCTHALAGQVVPCEERREMEP